MVKTSVVMRNCRQSCSVLILPAKSSFALTTTNIVFLNVLNEGSSAIGVLRRKDYLGGADGASMAALLRLLSSSTWRVR